MADDRCKPLQSASSCCWSRWWKSGDESYKRGLNTKIHLAVDAHGMPLSVTVTEGTRADCKEACVLIDGVSAEALLAQGNRMKSKGRSSSQNGEQEVVIPACGPVKKFV